MLFSLCLLSFPTLFLDSSTSIFFLFGPEKDLASIMADSFCYVQSCHRNSGHWLMSELASTQCWELMKSVGHYGSWSLPIHVASEGQWTWVKLELLFTALSFFCFPKNIVVSFSCLLICCRTWNLCDLIIVSSQILWLLIKFKYREI